MKDEAGIRIHLSPVTHTMSTHTPTLNRDEWGGRVDLHQERRGERLAALVRARQDIVILAGLVLFAVAVLLPTSQQALEARRRLAEVGREGDATHQRLQAIQRDAARLDQQLARWSRYGQSQERRRAWTAVMSALSGLTPATVVYDRVQVDRKDLKTQALLNGQAESMQALRQCVDSLSRFPLFRNVRLAEATESPTLEGGLRFKITAEVGIPSSR